MAIITSAQFAEFDNDEELLQELKNRFVMFPIKYKAIWDMYKKAESSFWTAEEVDLSKDMSDWEKLNENERHFVKHILAFFAGSDGIVNENLSVRFMNDIKAPEAKSFYGFQIAMENIHCVSYDTDIMTNEGYVTIGSVEGKIKTVWNGEEFSDVMIMKTHHSAPLMEVQLEGGLTLKCTPNHQWLVKNLVTGQTTRIPCEQLRQGMVLVQPTYPDALLELRDQDIFSNVEEHGRLTFAPEGPDYNPAKFNCRPQHFVPTNYSIRTKVAWLNGVMKNASPMVCTSDIMLSHPSVSFIKQLQLLLTTMHVTSLTFTVDGVGYIRVPATPNGLQKLLEYGVRIADDDILTRVLYDGCKSPDLIHFEERMFTIKSVEALEGLHPTFCFEEPKNHTGVFNGILTGQSETYSLLIDTYIKDSQEKHRLLDAINTIPCIKKKAEWAMRWITDLQAPFAMRLVAFAVVEGIFFSGAFCSIFWLKERGLMPGLCVSNEFISRDEALHTEFAVLLYSMLKNRLPEEVVHLIIDEAVVIEDEFINESIPCNLLGMNSGLMSEYIKFVADRLLIQLGYNKKYNAQNPFSFMDRICLSQKSNFFENTRLSEYSKANVGVTDVHNFTLDADF